MPDRTFSMNWDDIKIFLAMVRHATVRAAADLLGTSHSTVARRIIALEKGLGVRLFDRTAHGYNLTPAGKDILATAESMEREVMTLERRVVGRDQKLTGHVRVATSDFLATHLLIPSLPAFGRQYPEINVEIVTGYESLDIEKREADIALRITPKPPPHLVGKRLAAVAFAPFVSRDYLRQHDLQPSTSCWIGYQRNASEATPDWVHNSAYPHLPVRGVFESLLSQLSAARAGLGIGMLPCLLGDPDPLLVRLEPGKQPPILELWLLTHRDVRTTARLRTLMQFIAGVMGQNKALLEGREGRITRPIVAQA
jgi:DNA-binding transcriptional LysR family regulator